MSRGALVARWLLVLAGTTALALVGLMSHHPAPRVRSGPPSHPWASFPAGAWVEKREVVRDRSAAIREEVVGSTPDGVRVRSTTTIDGQAESFEVVIGTRDEDWSREGYARDGDERVEAEDLSVSASRWVRGGTTRWFSDEVPAWPVRELVRDVDGTTTESRLLRAYAPRKVGDLELPCLLFEERRGGPRGATMVTRVWRCQRVPGHVVAREGLMDGLEVRLEVTAFDPRR